LKKRAAICLLASLPITTALAAGDGHVWQDKRRFAPFSRTAEGVTGPIRLSGDPQSATPGSVMTIAFGNGKSARLTSLGARGWNGLAPDKATAGIYRIDHNPGRLLLGNRICGAQANKDPIFFVFDDARAHEPDKLLELDVFQSAEPPSAVDSPGLCGIYYYTIR